MMQRGEGCVGGVWMGCGGVGVWGCGGVGVGIPDVRCQAGRCECAIANIQCRALTTYLCSNLTQQHFVMENCHAPLSRQDETEALLLHNVVIHPSVLQRRGVRHHGALEFVCLECVVRLEQRIILYGYHVRSDLGAQIAQCLSLCETGHGQPRLQ